MSVPTPYPDTRRPPAADERAPATGPGPLLGVSRLGVVVLLVLALGNGLFLFLVPGRAAVDYAWAIKPPINAAFFGAGYLAGTVATALVVFRARSWRSLRILPLPLTVLSVTLLTATLLHRDRFFWDYAPTWGWTVVYAAVPLLVLGFWRLQERAEGPPPVADPRLDAVRLDSVVLGVVLAAAGLALLLAPTRMADVWPWPLTPLLAQVTAGWYLLVASALITAAVSLRRRHEVLIPYATLGTWSALLLTLPVLHPGDITGPDGALAAWVVVHVLLLAHAAYALAVSLPALRDGSERL